MKVDTSEKQRHDTTQEILEPIVKRMEALESRLEKPSYRPQQASRRCYNCNEEGHYRRNCPHVERSDSSQMRKKKAQEQFKVCGGTSKTMRVRGFMGDSPVEFLIDSGAAVSVVRYETIPHSMVIANSASSAVGANGDSLDVIGCIELTVVLDTLNVKHSFIVVKRLTVECILGIDFLSKYGAVIDCANDMVSFGSRVHAADPTPQIGNATANVVIVEETARIPSRSSCIVSATVQNGDALSGRVGVLEPHDNIPSSLLVARSLNTVSKANVIAIQVTNTGHSETTLYKGTQIGIFSIEHYVMALNNESAGSVLDDILPEIDLFNTDLTTQQSVELQKLIWEFRGIFASADGSLGRTSVTRHSIQTSEPPVREPLRRIPHFLKDTVSAEIKKMLNQGVIRESNSPWSSAVVMVRKKDAILCRLSKIK